MFDTCRRRKELAKEMLCALAGIFSGFGRKECNLIEGKHNNDNSFAAAPGAKVLILYYQDCVKLPMSIQEGEKNPTIIDSFHQAYNVWWQRHEEVVFLCYLGVRQ